MAETQVPKRPREEDEHHLFSCEVETTKHHKTYNHYTQILSILDDNTEDDNYNYQHQETTQGLMELFTSLQQELSSSDPLPKETQEEVKDGEEKQRVIKHLLEASDDELGIPYSYNGGDDAEEHGVFSMSLCDELLEVEDDKADNYCTLLHSELIM